MMPMKTDGGERERTARDLNRVRLQWLCCMIILERPGRDTPEKLEALRALPELTAALHGAIDARVAAEYRVEEGGA